MPFNRLAGDVVGRGKLAAGLSVVQDQAVTVADAGIKLQVWRVEQLGQIGDELNRFFGGDLVRAVVDHGLVFVGVFVGEADQVAAESHVVRLHLHAQSHGLQRRTAAVIAFGIKAHHRHVGSVGTGGHAFRDSAAQTDGAVLRHVIHIRLVRRLQGSTAAQSFHGIVGHAVAQADDIFHVSGSFLIWGYGSAVSGRSCDLPGCPPLLSFAIFPPQR